MEPNAVEVLNQYAQFAGMFMETDKAVELLTQAMPLARTRDDVQDLNQVSFRSSTFFFAQFYFLLIFYLWYYFFFVFSFCPQMLITQESQQSAVNILRSTMAM